MRSALASSSRSPLSSLFSLGLPALVVFAAIGGSTAACSGASESAVGGPAGSASAKESGLPCCHSGFIYRCATETALNACADTTANDTTDCTKTATTCGGSTSSTSSSGASGSSGSSGGTSSTSSSSSSSGSTPKKKTGDKCSLEKECEGELCLVFGAGSAGFCSNTCATTSQCPSKFRCELADKLGSKVCVPMGEKRIGETCTYNLDCDSNLCLTVGAAALGYCTAQCSVPAECPAAWSCEAVGGASGKFCKRP